MPIETASAKSPEVEHVTAGEPMRLRPARGGPTRQAAKVTSRARIGPYALSVGSGEGELPGAPWLSPK